MWVEITDICRSTAAKLTEVDPMISAYGFSLHDSMSAVELMDPKMDQCFQLKGPMKVEDLLDVPLPAIITIASVKKIIQVLVTYEAAFLDGASVLESTHNCIYLWDASWHRLEACKNRANNACEAAAVQALLAYCQSLHMSLWNASRIVLEADIYEDEDFQPQVSPWVNAGAVSTDSATTGLQEALAGLVAFRDNSDVEALDLREDIDQLVALLNMRLAVQDLLDSMNSYTAVGMRHATAMRRLVLQTANSYVNSQELEENSRVVNELSKKRAVMEAKLVKERLQLATVQEAYSAYEKARGVAEEACARLATITGPCESEGGTASATGEVETRTGKVGGAEVSGVFSSPDTGFAFSSTLVRTQQNSPVRTVFLRSFASSVGFLQKIVGQLCVLGTVCEEMEKIVGAGDPDSLTGKVLTYDHVLAVTMRSSEQRNQLLTRSLQLCYLNVLTCERMKDLVAASMHAWGLPTILLTGSLVSDNWVPETLCRTFWDTLKVYCVCRNRQVVRLDGVFQSWAIVMDQAGEIDVEFRREVGIDESDTRQHWCTYWAITQLGLVMDSYFSLTIESQLLSPNEVDYFFWYWDHVAAQRLLAHDTLLGMRHQLQMATYNDQMETHLLEETVRKNKDKDKTKKGKKGAKQAKDEVQDIPQKPLPPIGAENGPPSAAYYVLRGRKELCRGFLRVAAGLAKVGTCVHATNARKLRNPHTAWAWRFVQRFRAFQPINQPKMLVYDDFVEIVGEEEVGEQGAPQLVYNILSAAGACFKEAKLLFDAARKVTTTHGVDGIHTPCEVYAIQDAPTLLKVAVTNAVHCMQLSMIVKKQLEDVHGQQFPPTPPDEKIKQQFLVVDNKLHVHFPVLKLV